MEFLLFPYAHLSHLDHISSYISYLAASAKKIFPLFYFLTES